MKTDFNILWIDDDKPYVQSTEKILKHWLDNFGFSLNIIWFPNEKGVFDKIKETNVELIIVDYRMPQKKGDEVITDIRNQHLYHDIIFYSAADLPKITLDGVFFVSKEDSIKRIKELIELKLEKLIDPISVRGWIVADAIELEIMITDMLSSCITEKDGYGIIERFFYCHNSPLEFGRKVDILNGILNDLIEHEETQSRKEKLCKCKDVFKKFKKEIVEVRNAIAHQKVEFDGEKTIIKMKTKDATPIEINSDQIIKIRNNIRKQYSNLQELQQIF
jgi:CheY-like chemotaxis protein